MNFTPLNLAYSSLYRQKKRTLLTMLAISIGIAAVITIMSAGRGIQHLVLGQLDAFGPNSISVEVRVPVGKKNNFGGPGSVGITVTTLKDKDLQTIQKNSNVVAAYGMVMGQEAVSYGGQIKKIFLSGHGYAMPEVETFNMLEGRFYTQGEEESLAAVAVLGSKAKNKIFGDESAVDKTIYIRGKPFRVIGVSAPRGQVFFFDYDDIIFIPARTMQKKLLGINYFNNIIARLRDNKISKQTVEELAADIRANHDISDPNKDDFIIQTTADAVSTLTTITSGVTLLLVALVCVSLVVGGVGIMNIMYVSVAERTFEIGLRKSVGARSRDILAQFLAEAILITLGGGVVGIFLGLILALIIYLIANSFNISWIYSIPLNSILLSVAFSASIGLIFGYYPASRAAKLNPIEALRRE